MTNNGSKGKVFLILMAFCITLLSADQLSKDKLIQFADFLFENRDFSRAAYEYLRVVHLYDNSQSELDELNFRIGNCFSFLNQADNARKYYEYCLQPQHDENIYKKALASLGFLLFKIGKYHESISVLQGDELFPTDEILNTIILANYLCLENEEMVGTKFIEFKNAGRPYIAIFDKYLDLKKNLKFKSPIKAGLISAVIPGSGRIYAGRLKEGLVSMISFFATSYLAYEGFKDRGISSFKGWLFSSITAFLYIGNIYGSVIAARITNDRIRKGYIKGIEISLNLLIHEK